MIHQWEAIQGHDTCEGLARVEAPTLVLAGSDDVLASPENSMVLAERIPSAQLQVIEGSGHQFLVEQADVFNRAVLEFLEILPMESYVRKAGLAFSNQKNLCLSNTPSRAAFPFYMNSPQVF